MLQRLLRIRRGPYLLLALLSEEDSVARGERDTETCLFRSFPRSRALGLGRSRSQHVPRAVAVGDYLSGYISL